MVVKYDTSHHFVSIIPSNKNHSSQRIPNSNNPITNINNKIKKQEHNITGTPQNISKIKHTSPTINNQNKFIIKIKIKRNVDSEDKRKHQYQSNNTKKIHAQLKNYNILYFNQIKIITYINDITIVITITKQSFYQTTQNLTLHQKTVRIQ